MMSTESNTPFAHDDLPDEENASGVWRFFILQPTFGLLLLVLLIAGGLIAYDSLVKESLPDLEIPQATISTFWPGADPQTIEQEVTKKLEQHLATLKGVKKITSASFDSYSLIGVEFVAEADLAESMQLLRSKISDAEVDLPREIEKPTVNQISVDDRPILSVVLYGDVNAAMLSRTAQELEDRLERVQGINEVKIGGLRKEVIRIQLKPERLNSLRISPVAVRNAIQEANRDMPWGDIDSDELGGTVRLYGRFRDLDDLRALPISRLDGGGRVVRLEEVADVRRDLERESSRAYVSFEGKPYKQSIEISLTKVPGADTLKAIENVEAELQSIRAEENWPHGLEYRITSNQSEKIWESLLRVFDNAWQAMLCVFVILFVMLTWREALIAGLSIPVSFLGAMTIVWMLGYTLNEMVLIGMVLALGLLVDVFILMMEGMHEGIYVENRTFGQAAMATVRRFALPAFAGQMTTILALAPLMAISGVSGKFIRILPVTTICCLVISFIVALLIDVPLSRYLLGRVPRTTEDKQTLVDRLTQWCAQKLGSWSLTMTVSSKFRASIVVLGTLVIFVISAAAFSTMPMQMYSERDGRILGVTVELPAGTTLETSQRCADMVGEILREKGYLESTVKLVGKKSPMSGGALTDSLSPTTGDYLVGFSSVFVPRENREMPAYEYLDSLREEITEVVDNNFPGANIILAAETGKPEAGDPVQFEIIGDDMEKLRELSKQVQLVLKDAKGTVDVRDNLGNMQVDIRLTPKREALDFYEITHEDLASQIRYAMTDQEIGKFALGGVKEDLEIRLGTAWPSRNGALGGPTVMEEMMTVRAFRSNGETIPVMAVVEPTISMSPLSITRQDGQRSIVISSKVSSALPAEVVAEVTPKLTELAEAWPSGYSFRVAGEAQDTAETFGSAGSAMIVALFLVFALLVLLFTSFTQPFIIVLTIPMAMIGTFTGFFLLDMPFSFTAMIGIISLIGIVVNDAIVMVETMNKYLSQGMTIPEAAARGGAARLRPIVSTSLTTTIGVIPLMLSDPMWEPLCCAIIFGLIASTFFSLLVIPPLYVLLTKKSREVVVNG